MDGPKSHDSRKFRSLQQPNRSENSDHISTSTRATKNRNWKRKKTRCIHDGTRARAADAEEPKQSLLLCHFWKKKKALTSHGRGRCACLKAIACVCCNSGVMCKASKWNEVGPLVLHNSRGLLISSPRKHVLPADPIFSMQQFCWGF